MDFKQISVYEVLKIENVELFETFKDNGVLITKGTMLVLYSQEYNWFILKINDFNYGLNKSIPLLASSREEGIARAYVLPTKDSYFVIKIASAFDTELSKLEDVLRNNTDFAYKEGAKGEGLPIELDHGTVKIKKVAPDAADKSSWSAAQIIYSGGKNIHKLMVSSAEAIAGGMNKVGTHIETAYIPEKAEQVPVTPRAMGYLSMFNSATGMATSMSTFYIKGLMSFSKSIAQRIAQTFEKQDFEKEVKEIREKEEERGRQIQEQAPTEGGNVLTASVHSAIMIWHGLAEALEIITTGFSETTSNIVRSKYGPLAGEVFKAGVGVVGSRVRVPTMPGQKYLRYVNKF